MRREGRVRGKPTSKSRLTGRCRSGKTRCCSCRDHPVEKSREKRMGRYKRFAGDVCTNPALADFLLQPRHTRLQAGGLEDHGDEGWCSSIETDENILVATVNSVIEAAFAKMHDSCGDECESDETTAMAFTTYELANGAAILAGDCTDIASIESAFEKELGIFENAVEGSNFSQFVRKIRGSTLSEESWSEVDLLEADQESSADDDWSMVDFDGDEV